LQKKEQTLIIYFREELLFIRRRKENMNYYSVLEKNIQIQLMILENLYHAQTCCTLEELSQSTNSDKRSILNYCEYIKELSKHKVKKEDKGYVFTGTVVDYQLLLLKILECSAIFHLIKKICFQPKVDLHEFSYENNISVPSLRRHITRVNQLLEKYHLQLKTSKGAVYIKGNELHVRYLIYLILWQSYQGVIWPFSMIDFQELFSGIEYAFQLTRQKPNKIKMIEWCYIIAITLLRSEQGNSINKTDLPEFTEDLWENFGDITKKLQRMSEKAEINLEEMKFLFLWL
jgi:transcriptional antiterminator